MVDAETRRSTGKAKGKAGGKNPWLEQLSEETKRQIIFDKLVARAQKPDPQGCFYLHEELEKEESSVEVALELIKWGKDRAAKVNGEGSLPIHVASRNIRQIEPVIFLHLLEAYPNSISTANKVGNLPIHIAAIHAGLDGDLNRRAFNSIEMLIEANTDAVQIGNVEGLLPVHLAISGQRIPSLELIHMLLEPFPEAASIQDNYGHIPLHKAVSKSRPHIELIEFLVEVS
jgi:ankyrin repeat protein